MNNKFDNIKPSSLQFLNKKTDNTIAPLELTLPQFKAGLSNSFYTAGHMQPTLISVGRSSDTPLCVTVKDIYIHLYIIYNYIILIY